MEAVQAEAIENQSNIRQLGTVSVDTVTLTTDEIKYFWAVGILPDIAYIALALQIDKRKYKEMAEIDFGAFIERWCFIGEKIGDKFISSKVLKSKQVRDAIHKLEAADFIKVEQQLSLELNY
jgi:hypothetical protein